jgi:phosphatidate cytidylyltransferase
MKNELPKRLFVAGFGIPLMFGAILYGKLPFFIFINLISVIALWEFYSFADFNKDTLSKIIGLLSVIAICMDMYLSNGNNLKIILTVTVLTILITELFKKREHRLGNMGSTLLGILYLSLFSSFILLRKIRSIENDSMEIGGKVVMLVFIAIWLCDTTAYFFGSRFGKTVLFHRISPKKTWEGALAGFFMAVVSAMAFKILFIHQLPLIDSIICGIIVGTIGQISDLVESMLKRDVKVKDSSNILPGHGGILDRFDTPMLIGPVLVFYFLIRHYSF